MSAKYQIKVKSCTKNLAKIGNFIEEVLRNAGIEKNIRDEILIAADEAATNIILHSYKNNPEGYIKVTLIINDEKVVLSLFDKGETFDPEKVIQPDFTKDLSERKLGGLGIFLMRKFMDEVTYYFKNTDTKKENEVRMIKYIKKSGGKK